MNWKKLLRVAGAVSLAFVIAAIPLLSGGCGDAEKEVE